MLFTLLSFGVILCLTYIYWKVNSRYGFWKEKNIPFVKPLPIFGNYKDYILLREYAPKIAQNICRKFPNSPYVGSYYGTKPVLIVQDPGFIKLVITKDFNHFSGRELTDYSHYEQLTQNIFNFKESNWKMLRQNLTRLFSISKIKNMFHLLQDCTTKFENLIKEETLNNKEINVKSLSARYTMDCIASCAFGVDTETMNSNIQDNQFVIIGNKIFGTSNYRGLQIILRSMWPDLFYTLGYKLFPNQVYNFFHSMLTKVFESRRSIQSVRNDFVDHMLIWKERDFISDNPETNVAQEERTLKVNDDFLVAQCMLLFAAGFDTTASTLSLTLYELAKNPKIQAQFIEEVDVYIEEHSGNIEFDSIIKLSFLDACVNEVLRMYPVLGIIPREVVKNYTFPTGLRLEKGAQIHIPVYHLHYNPDYFPDPDTFKPDRFFGKGKADIIPYTYLPFGEGPRICLGQQFAKANLLAGLVTIFKNYQVELGANTPMQLEFDPKGILTQIKGDIQLKFISRKYE